MASFLENSNFFHNGWKTVPLENITLWNCSKSKMSPNAIKHYGDWHVHERCRIFSNSLFCMLSNSIVKCGMNFLNTLYVCGKRLCKYMPNMFDVHVTVKVWNQYCFCISHSTKHYLMVKWRKARHRLGTSSNMWAAAWQNQQNDLCTERRHRSALAFSQSDHLRCPHEEPCTLSYPLNAQSLLGAHVILLVLSWNTSYDCHIIRPTLKLFLFPFTKPYTTVSKREGSLGWWNIFFISERGKMSSKIW